SGCLAGIEAFAKQGELIASQARHGHAIVLERAQALGYGNQQAVAVAVAEAFVDVLEVVEVNQQQGATASVRSCSFQVELGPLAEQQPIGQADQVVVMRQVVQLLA